MNTPEILETASEIAEVWKTPKSSRREQAQWAIAHVLVSTVVGIHGMTGGVAGGNGV